jgi:hypothetical protein
MSTNYLQGSEGSCDLTTDHKCQFNTWSATASHAVHDITGFGDSARRRLLGIADLTGSAGGITIADATNHAPGFGTGIANNGSTGSEITLNFRTTNECKWVFKAVIDSIAATVTAGGDNAVTFNFQLASTGTTDKIVETWDEA